MSTKAELENKLQTLEERVDTEFKSFNPQKHKDETRSQIALFVVRGYFYIIGGILIGIPAYNLIVVWTGGEQELTLSVKDLISTISGAISGIFGFVVGYYFKGTENN